MLRFEHPNLGRLVQPRHYPRLRATAARGVPWAADNDAFGGFGEKEAERFEKMLEVVTGVPGCLFVACPDVVGDAHATDLLFDEWEPRIARLDLPVAYVIQEPNPKHKLRPVPWGSIDAIFIGCASDREKLGERVRRIVAEATRRKKWVHMGRVNSARRIAYAAEIGCDSIDGTGWMRWRDRNLPRGLSWVANPRQINTTAS